MKMGCQLVKTVERYLALDQKIVLLLGDIGVFGFRNAFNNYASRVFNLGKFNSLEIILDWLFDKYLCYVDAIYEFGCGTGHNLLRARRVNPNAILWGMDWATVSQQKNALLAEHKIDHNIQADRFDYFNPDDSFRIKPNSVVYTLASLEQVGARWENFIDYLLSNKPKLCIHVEPIAELLDSNKLIDYLSIEYFKKRNYLEGFLSGLLKLEKQVRVRIHRSQRTHIGSLFVEGYSEVVWSPVTAAQLIS